MHNIINVQKNVVNLGEYLIWLQRSGAGVYSMVNNRPTIKININ